MNNTSYYHVEPQKFVVAHCPMCKGSGKDESGEGVCPFCEGGHIVTYPPMVTVTTTWPECAHTTTYTVGDNPTRWCADCGKVLP